MITTASPFIGMMAALSQRHFTRSPARIRTHTHTHTTTTTTHLHTHNAASVCCKNSKCDPIVFQCVLKILWRIISRYPNRIRTHLSHYTHTHTRRRRRGELASLVTLFSTWHQHNFSFLIWYRETHTTTQSDSQLFLSTKKEKWPHE